MKDKVEITIKAVVEVPSNLNDAKLKRAIVHNSESHFYPELPGWTNPINIKFKEVKNIKCISL